MAGSVTKNHWVQWNGHDLERKVRLVIENIAILRVCLLRDQLVLPH